MKGWTIFRWLLVVALFLIAAFRNKATVGLCPAESGGRDISDGLQNYGQHELEMEVEEDYGGEYLNDIMEAVDFPDGVEDDDDDDKADDTPRGSGKGYLRLFHGRDAILCPHLQRYLEQLERS